LYRDWYNTGKTIGIKHKIRDCGNKGDLLMKLREIIGTVVIVIAVVLMLLSLGYGFLRDIVPIRTIQMLNSPYGKYRAVLKRIDSIDVNFYVIVNGKRVYMSPDFAPNSEVDFRERLVWDKTGRCLILEVTGRRLFGYNADAKKELPDAELMSIEYAPEPNEREYGFEGTWPDEKVNKENR
jgi:hypothetical protein